MTSGPAPGPTDRLPALDGLRGAAILVVIFHNLSGLDAETSRVGHLAELALDFGWAGVQLFFALSGFLITGILLDSRDRPSYYRSFFGRRVLRIFPLYYTTLFVTLVVLPAFVRLPPVFAHDRAHQLSLWLYVSNWTAPFGLGGAALPHFWSLAVEEQFYLAWPFLVRRRTPLAVLRWCAVLAVASLYVRVGMVWAGVDAEAVYGFTICRMDALGLGGAAAALLRLPDWRPRVVAWRGRLWAWAGVLGLGGLVATHGFPRTLPIGQTLGYTILAVVFGLVVLAAASSDLAGRPASRGLALLRSAPLRVMGKYSYAMYVFHKPLHDLLGKRALQAFGLYDHPGVAPTLAYGAVGTLVSLLLAVLSYHLLEKHFLALKRHFAVEPAPP